MKRTLDKRQRQRGIALRQSRYGFRADILIIVASSEKKRNAYVFTVDIALRQEERCPIPV